MNALIHKQNNRNQRRSLRRWLRSAHRRHDPWLVFNMSNFTFDHEFLHALNRVSSHQRIWH